jgi:hypothetical protein
MQRKKLRVGRLRVEVAAIAVGLASAVGACGNDGGATTVPRNAAPQEVAEVADLKGIHSGVVYAGLFVTKLKRNESISFSFNGSFRHLGEGDLPQFFIAANSGGRWNGRRASFSSRLLVLSNGAEVSYGSAAGEKGYAVDSSILEGLRSKVEQTREGGGRGDVTACLKVAQQVDLAQLVRNPKLDGWREEADGTKVVSIVGDLVIDRLRKLLVQLARDPACGAQMEALGLPTANQLEAARLDFKKGVKGVPVTVAVDKHGVIRELSTRFECARLNGEFFELQLNFTLREVNRAVEVSGSPEGEPLDKLLRKFGTSEGAALRAEGDAAVIAFLEGLSGAMTGRLP